MKQNQDQVDSSFLHYVTCSNHIIFHATFFKTSFFWFYLAFVIVLFQNYFSES